MDGLGWLADLAGTLIGAGVGLALAMWWDRKRDREKELHDCAMAMRSILLNLEDIDERLDVSQFEATDTDQDEQVQIDFSKPFISSAPFEASVASGRLALFNPELQERLSTAYELIRELKLHLDVLATAYSSPGGPEEHSQIMSNALEYFRSYARLAKDLIRETIVELRASLGLDQKHAEHPQ